MAEACRHSAAVTATAEPYTELDRQKATFDAPFAKVGVLPAQVFVRNGSDRPLVVRPSDIRLGLPNGRELSPSPPSAVVTRLKSSDYTGAMALGGIFGFFAATQAEQQARTERLADYRGKLLQDATILKDESAQGFIFFILPDGTPPFAEAPLRIRFVDVDAGTSTVVDLPLAGLRGTR